MTDQMYTGKQLISTCLPNNINYDTKTDWYNENLGAFIHYDDDERHIKVRRGELISGVTDKSFSKIFSSIYFKYSATKAMDSLFNYQ